MAVSINPPLGFQVHPIVVRMKNTGSAAIVKYDLCIADFINGTNDPDRTSDTASSVTTNGFTCVKQYDASVHLQMPGYYFVAQEAVAAGAYGQFMLCGVTRIKTIDGSTNITKGDPLKAAPSAGTDGAVYRKATATHNGANTVGEDFSPVLAIALESSSADGTFLALFDGRVLNGAAVP